MVPVSYIISVSDHVVLVPHILSLQNQTKNQITDFFH